MARDIQIWAPLKSSDDSSSTAAASGERWLREPFRVEQLEEIAAELAPIDGD